MDTNIKQVEILPLSLCSFNKPYALFHPWRARRSDDRRNRIRRKKTPVPPFIADGIILLIMHIDKHTNYYIYTYFGRRVFAAPANNRDVRLAGAMCYQPYTIKRALFRWFVHTAIQTRVDNWLCVTTVNPSNLVDGFDYYRWMSTVSELLSIPDLVGVVFWPPQRDRGRIYVYLFDEKANAIAFAKIALDVYNSHGLERECRALGVLHSKRLQRTRVPRVLCQGMFADHAYLITESIPLTARPVKLVMASFPRDCISEYAHPVRFINAKRVSSLSWWSSYQDVLCSKSLLFDDDLNLSLQKGLNVCFAHGDMGGANIVRDSDSLWVYDWENACADAPELTDEIGFYLAINFTSILTNPVKQLRNFQNRYLRNIDQRQRGAVLSALAFRASSGINDALLLIHNWNKLELAD